ncbi:MAG: L-rhamnose mutarotase [Litorimonas sp.]
MKRMGWVINLKPEKKKEYLDLHAAAWPNVLGMIRECNIRNYTIYLREPDNLLFGTFEYHGSDFESDMKRMAEDTTTQRWWALTDPCQTPLKSADEGEHWAPMQEVFHCD